MWENTDQKNSVFAHFSRSAINEKWAINMDTKIDIDSQARSSPDFFDIMEVSTC